MGRYGTRLGLSTTLRIVRAHGGFVGLKSEAGRGAVFSVYLPANSGALGLPAGTNAEIGLPRGCGECVLIVDDEESIRSITRMTLESFGYESGSHPTGRMQFQSLQPPETRSRWYSRTWPCP